MLWQVIYWVNFEASQLDTLHKHFDMSVRTKQYLKLGAYVVAIWKNTQIGPNLFNFGRKLYSFLKYSYLWQSSPQWLIHPLISLRPSCFNYSLIASIHCINSYSEMPALVPALSDCLLRRQSSSWILPHSMALTSYFNMFTSNLAFTTGRYSHALTLSVK